jgi:hypothetical protein
VRRGWTRALGVALLLLGVGAGPTQAQVAPPTPGTIVVQVDGPEAPPAPQPDPRLATALLTEADLPAGLRLQPRASGQVVVPGLSGHLATYLRAEPDEAADFRELLFLPAGTIVLVKTSVQVLTREALTPGVLDSVILGAQAAATAGGALVDSTTDYGGLPVGESSRGHSARYRLLGAPPTTSTVIAFRRGDVIAALNVEATGDDPAFEEALRLARIVDERLLALAAPATPTTPGATPASVTPTPSPPAPAGATATPGRAGAAPGASPRP